MSTYVCSDLHGDLKRFNLLKDSLSEEDNVFILGDVIDRGPGGIEILSTIMSDPRFTLLMGNHEYMMVNFLHHTFNDELDEALECGRLWLIYNGGEVTFDAYKQLDPIRQEDILNFLKDLPVQKNVEINGHSFLLVHSHPILKGKDVQFKNLTSTQVERAVWDRVRLPAKCHLKGKTILAGHTIINPYGISEVAYDGKSIEQSGYINLDCGCALGNENSRLGVLCLENFSIRYF